MKEIEILVEVYSTPQEIIKTLEKFEFLGINETIDTYFYDPLRDNLKPNGKLQIDECFRVRTKNNINTIKQALKKIEKVGILVQMSCREESDGVEVCIRLQK